MEQETILLILSFLIGWVGHTVWSYVLNLGYSAYMVRYVSYSLMCIAKLVSDQVGELMYTKYDSLSQMGLEKNKIKLMKNEDKRSLEAMQQKVVDIMRDNYPKPFTHQIDFNNWNQMMKHISENRRRNNA